VRKNLYFQSNGFKSQRELLAGFGEQGGFAGICVPIRTKSEPIWLLSGGKRAGWAAVRVKKHGTAVFVDPGRRSPNSRRVPGGSN
jgi:hypothetical protein